MQKFIISGIFLFCFLFQFSINTFSQIAPVNNRHWGVINTTLSGKINFISKHDHENSIYYAVGGTLRKIVENNESLVFDFSADHNVLAVYSSVGSSFIRVVTNKGVYKILNNEAEILYQIPSEPGDSYNIRQSFLWLDRVVLIISGYRYNGLNVKTFLLRFRNDLQPGFDSLYMSTENFHGTQLMFTENGIIIEGPKIYSGPCSMYQRKEKLIWDGTRFIFDSGEEFSGRRNNIINSNELTLNWDFIRLECSPIGIVKFIEGNGPVDQYYSHHDGFWTGGIHSHWVPAETIGADFNPLGGVKMGDNILFFGPVALDRDMNNTSVRMYSLTNHSFRNEGRGLDSISSMWYKNSNSSQGELLLGSRGKIYVRISSYTEPISSDISALKQNYPNPFNPTTAISFSIKEIENIKLAVYDIAGKELVTLVNEKKLPGDYEVVFNASILASGVYFYRLIANKTIETRRMILLK